MRLVWLKAKVGLQLGLMTTSIANKAVCDILASMNIPLPNENAMQSLAARISEDVKLNKEDSINIRSELVIFNQLLQIDNPEMIRAEGDGRDNNWLGTGDASFQPATQVVYSILENVTNQKKVISVVTGNQLCKTGQLARQRDETATCPHHPGTCTANIKEDDIIGDERKWAANCIEEMKQDVSERYFTSDGDSKVRSRLSAKFK